MKRAVVVCILVIMLACMWSSVALAETWIGYPDTPSDCPPERIYQVIVKNNNDITFLLCTDGYFYIDSPNRLYSEGWTSLYRLESGSWVYQSQSLGGWNLTLKQYYQGNVNIYTDIDKTSVKYAQTQVTPDSQHYILIGAIPHQLTIYESILVDTNWPYILVEVYDDQTMVYQETGAIENYSQPFSDGRINIPLANMGLQDGITYTFKVYGSVDGQVWWDSPYPYMQQTVFTFYQSEADEVRVMGITDGKTYAYAPMISWRKSGKYRNATLKVLLNGYQIYRGEASNGYVNLAYLPAEDKEFLKVGTGPLKENDIRVIVEQPGDDYLAGNWGFWVSHDIMDMWNDNEDQPLPGVIDWDSDDSIIEQIKNTGQEAIQVVKVAFDFVPPEIMLLIILGFTLVIALRILGR